VNALGESGLASTYGCLLFFHNCSNNVMGVAISEIDPVVISGSRGEPIPLYGDGWKSADCCMLEDHVMLSALSHKRTLGQKLFGVGGHGRAHQPQVVAAIALTDELTYPDKAAQLQPDYICHLDRPGHDRRYAIDP